MSKLVIDQIIMAIQDNPNTDILELVESFRDESINQIEHAYFAAESKTCELGRVSTFAEYLKKCFDLEV